jgi:hypothetical protein
MCTVEITAAPALDHDAMMLARFGCKVSPNGYLERAILWNLCAHLAARGFLPFRINDGDEMPRVSSAKEVLELAFNLDEVSVRFRKGKRGAEHGVLVMIGEGDTLISDWNYNDGDADGFNAAMESFDPFAIAPALLVRGATA